MLARLLSAMSSPTVGNFDFNNASATSTLPNLVSSPSSSTMTTYNPTHSPSESLSTLDLEKGTGPNSTATTNELPTKKYGRILRNLRHTFFNVYRRLFSIVFLLNMVGLGLLLGWKYTGYVDDIAFLEHLATGTSANIMVALLIRQDYVVNALFRATWIIPSSAPLRLRRILCKVYEFGGVHSGAAVSSVLWFTIFTIIQTITLAQTHSNLAFVTPTYILLVILFSLCITAYPRFRFSSHNTFENVHRWGGWFSLAIFWVELSLFAHSLNTANLGLAMIRLPAFWFLLISSLHAIYPWLRLHKMTITAERLSDHATRLHFTEPIPLFVGLRISDAPLKEWHSFAAIPSRVCAGGGSVLISNAGDWTRKTIDNPKPYYWVKGVPVTGVLCMARIFTKIVVVTTGSGIGPVLAVIQDLHRSSVKVIWSTPSPLKTYGQAILDAVKEVDPEATILDSRAKNQDGVVVRPDLVKLAWEMYKREGAEAVFVISNPKVTRKVVYGLESRGVPAFGPVWDS